MKIAIPYIHTGTSAFGDDGQFVAQLSAGLARLRHEVTVYGRRGDPSLPKSASRDRYTARQMVAGPSHPLSGEQLIPAVQRFTEELLTCWRAHRPDVVHAQQWPAALATELAAQRLGIRTVVTPQQDQKSQRGTDEQSSARRLVARHADWLVVLNTTHAAQLTRRIGSRAQVAVVPCGVDVDHYTPQGLATPRGDFRHRLIYFSSGATDDGTDTAIEALTRITDTELLIVDAAPPAAINRDARTARIRALARRHEITDRVRLWGAISDDELPPLLRSADIVVHLPRTDPTGSIPIKAMACGVPVIASAIDAPADIVIDDVTGYLIAPINPRECATTVKRLLVQHFQRQALGAAGRDRAQSRYSWDRIAADTLQVYQQALTPAG